MTAPGRTFRPLGGVTQRISVPLVHDLGAVWEYGVSPDWVGMVGGAAVYAELGAGLS